MRKRLVCFDAGFTLLSPRRTLGEALADAVAEHGRTLSDEEMRTAFEVADRWFQDEYKRPGNDTWTRDESIYQTWRDFHAIILRELGLPEPQAELIERIFAAQFAPDAFEAYPDVRPALEALQPMRRDGLVVGVVSDWATSLRDIFVALELDRFFDFILASGAVGLSKPDPAFFRVALDRAEVRPREALMVGDSYRADVLGARAAGMDAVLLDRDGDASVDDVPIIRSLDELQPLLLRTDTADAAPALEAADA
jgi:putative hydrolase of the HAD superfamily